MGEAAWEGSRFRSRSPEDTLAAGRALGRAVRACGPGSLVVALTGPLGAGKTAFVKGLAKGMGTEPDAVTSPTFAIAAEIGTPAGRLVHVDLYRIESEGELEAAGLRDWLAGGVLAVEWADRFPGSFPSERLEVALRPGGADEARDIEASASGAAARAVLEAWQSEDPSGTGAEEDRTWR